MIELFLNHVQHQGSLVKLLLFIFAKFKTKNSGQLVWLLRSDVCLLIVPNHNRTFAQIYLQFQPGSTSSSANRSSLPAAREDMTCEICDRHFTNKRDYITHLHNEHTLLRGRLDMDAGPPLACSRCRERFWSYEGLERHLVMNHNLVTSDLLQKAQNKLDGGRCKHCKKVKFSKSFKDFRRITEFQSQ